MATAPQQTAQTPTDTQAHRRPYVLGAWLAYDADETLAQFFVRKKAALAAGDQAWREGKIKAHHQKVYERLVDAVGAHQYSWIKVETLADEFNADESTVKRWLAVLEKKAHLIRRKRQFKTSSRTYVVAYDQYQAQTSCDDQAAPETPDMNTEQPDVPEAAEPEADNTASADNDTPHAVGAPEEVGDSEAVFFERNDAPTYSAFVPPHIKDLPLNTSCYSSGVNTCADPSGVNGGGEKHTFDITNIDPDIRAIIADEAINTINGQHIVAARPIDELRAVQGYLDKQTNVRDRAGLFVWLNERQFGAELLAGRVRAAARQPGVPTAPSALQRRRQRGRPALPTHRATRAADHDPRCAACGHISAYLGLDDAFCEQCGVQPGDELGKHDGLTPDPALWHTIVAQLAIAPAERDVWLAPTMLAHYDDLLVLACPHKLVAKAIHTRYLAQIDAVTSALLGRPTQVELAVKYMPDVAEEVRTVWLHDVEQPIYPAWLRDDTQDVMTPHIARPDDEQQDASPLEAAAPREEACTLSPHVSTDHNSDSPPALPHAQYESMTELPVSSRMPSTHELWASVCHTVAIPLDERRIWLEPTDLLRIDEDHAIVSAPNIFVRNRLATHYHDLLAATLSTIVGRPLHIEVVTERSGAGRRL